MRYEHVEFTRRVLLGLAFLAASGCSPNSALHFDPPVLCRIRSSLDASVFLLGDAGAPDLAPAGSPAPDALVDPVLSALAAEVRTSVAALGADRTAVLVLGDNVYPDGMPPPGSKGYRHAARVLDAQIAAIGEARGFFTLGNHDWVQGDTEGWAHAKAQVDYLSSRGPNISVNPPGTCAGPQEVRFGEHLQLVFFDLWAAVYQIDHPDGRQSHCVPRAGNGRVIDEVGRLLGDTTDRRTVLVTHPPMLTSGPHGGYFPILEHIFPLRVFHRDLWIPLPVVGSLFPIARSLGVTDTDIMSSRYASYIERAKRTFTAGHPSLVVAGHEHSLQVHVDPTGVFHAVSGAGSSSKVDYVRDMRSDLMSLAAPGFMRLDVYDDGQMRLNVVAVDEKEGARLVFTTCIP